jgi:hypothetical protein
MHFDLYENAANNIIAMEGDFPITYAGGVGGESYYFELTQPIVEFEQNLMKIITVLKINTDPTGYLELNIQPSIYINYSLVTDNVTALLQNFPTYINSNFPQLPQWVREKIIDHYNTLQLEMYPAKLIDFAESFVPEYIDIEVSGINFTWQSLPGKLKIGIEFFVSGIPPNYECYTFNRTKVKIKSNVDADIIRLTVGEPFTVYYDYNDSIHVPKDGEVIFNTANQNNQATTQNGRYVRVLLHSDIRGTFLRNYDASYMPTNNQWTGPKPVQISID